MESFEFITQGMADIFINDREIYDTNPEAVLYRVLKEIRDIKETIFEKSSEDSYFYEPVRMEEAPRDLPGFKTFFNNGARKFEDSNGSGNQKTPESMSRKGRNSK
jgi:hypothetical protein